MTGRFTSEDTYWNPNNMIYGDDPNNIIPDPLAMLQANNLYAYTVNNPLRYIDPTGYSCEELEDEDTSWLKDFISDWGTRWGMFETTVEIGTKGVAGARTARLDEQFISGVANAPAGSGAARRIHNRNIAREIRGVEKAANSASQWTKSLPWIAVGIDVGTGIYDNVQAGTEPERIVTDAIADKALSWGSIWAAGKGGAIAGAKVGTIKPGLGNIAGAGAGFVLGVGSAFLLDGFEVFGNTVRGHARSVSNWVFRSR